MWIFRNKSRIQECTCCCWAVAVGGIKTGSQSTQESLQWHPLSLREIIYEDIPREAALHQEATQAFSANMWRTTSNTQQTQQGRGGGVNLLKQIMYVNNLPDSISWNCFNKSELWNLFDLYYQAQQVADHLRVTGSVYARCVFEFFEAKHPMLQPSKHTTMEMKWCEFVETKNVCEQLAWQHFLELL